MPASPYGRMPKPLCPPNGTPTRTLPNAVNTLLSPRSVLPKKSGLYAKSPSTPITPAPIHPRLAPQLKRLESIASPNSSPASPPKFQPMNGMNKPSARAAPAEKPQNSAAMMSVRQVRADRQRIVMTTASARRMPLLVALARQQEMEQPGLPDGARRPRKPRDAVGVLHLNGVALRRAPCRTGPTLARARAYFVVAAAGGAPLLCSSTTRRAR